MYQYAALAAYQIWSAYNQAEVIRDQAELTKNIAEMNAKYAEIDAWEAEKYGYTESARYQSIVDQTVGEQRAAFAAQNVDVSFGTAKEIQQESKVTGFLNQLDMQRQARAKAMGLKFEASNYRVSGSMSQAQGGAQGNATMNAGFANAGATAVSGYGKYATDMKKAGSTSNASSSGQMQPMTDPFAPSNDIMPKYRLGDWNYKRNVG